MKKKNIIAVLVAVVVIIAAVLLVSRYLKARTPILLQGTTECTTYKASSKIAGRIVDMKVEEGQRVERGELLYTLSTPELDAKLQQAEAVRSAASAIDQKVLSGARVQQIEAALNMWQQAQAGRELAKKTFDRVKALYEQGVVPAQKFDEAQAQYNATSHVWVFPSGAKIYFGSMQYTKDRTNYQGKAFDFIGFDELTHFEWEEYSYMMSRNRPTGPGTRVYLRATTNPGGVGHGWVKARFITPAPPGTPIVEQFPVRMPDGTEKVLERARVFIPSSVFDNPALLENDPDYLASLASLPEAEKQALLYGSWDSFSGQVFTEWRNDPGHYQDQRWTHVIAPFAIPRHWKIYRGYDFGFSKPFSVGWYAADEEGRLYRIKELYGCTGRPNEGLRIDPVEQARRIREAEQNDPMLKGRTILGVADPAIFDESRGESIAAMMERGPHFLHWVPGDHTRLAGKMQFHYRLAFDVEGRPMFQVFNTCRHFIRTLPNLVYDESNVEDIDTRQEDHIYDECRYVLMENPISPPRQTVQPPVGDDPLELHRRARFYRV